ncbi:hypothetical protein ABFV83_17245 [Lacrimispora sp. BS-2]|uniref:Sigma-70 family RNA polymerase sigma factor n=1 Tax=Lacrimispora sp. BS-2 TaxID=3151850 RepID=A0AAU7PMS2_9FIRM
MGEECFYKLVELSKNDSDAMMQLLEVMQPLIKSYKRKLFFLEAADAEQEMCLAIIEAVKNITECKTDGQCLTYLNNAVKFRFAYMCKRNLKKEEIEDSYKKDLDEGVYLEKYKDIETFYDLQRKVTCMNEMQKKILNYLLLDYSDSEIAKKIGISRQYVNRIKKKLL